MVQCRLCVVVNPFLIEPSNNLIVIIWSKVGLLKAPAIATITAVSAKYGGVSVCRAVTPLQ